jgi:hypothetical protein
MQQQQISWHEACQWSDVETAFQVYQALNGDNSYVKTMFMRELARSSYTRMPMETFQTLNVQNHRMSAVNQELVDQIVSTGQPSQSPLILAYFGGRVVLLTGHTQLRAAEICKSDVVFTHIEAYDNMCGLPSGACVIL